METISTTPSSPATPTGLRGTFLTIICILTFIGSGWGIIRSIQSYAEADLISNVAGGAMKTVNEQMDQQEVPNFVKQLLNTVVENLSPEAIRKLSIIHLISSLLTLTGAILMWNLKKTGFYIYITGIVVAVAAPVVIGELIGILGIGFTSLVGIIFIVMYAANLKFMTR
jgi:hypothetical protein